MSRRVHYGYMDMESMLFYPEGELVIACLIGDYPDEETYAHYELTTIEKKITCRTCRRYIDEAIEDARLEEEIHG